MSQVLNLGLKWGWGLVTIFTAIACSPGSKDIDGLFKVKDIHSLDGSIVGGTLVPNGHPISKSIVGVYNTLTSSMCTGSLLANNIVLTAAHCVDESFVATTVVMFGIDLNVLPEQRKVNRAKVSTYWESNQGLPSNLGDIALIHFVGDVPEGYVPATFLPSRKTLVAGLPVVLAGYGVTESTTNSGSGILRVAKATIADPMFSESEVKIDQSLGQGACRGDSGGPAYVYAEGKYYLFGITSRGLDDPTNDCSHAALYTNALAYRAWIKRTSIVLNDSLATPQLLSRSLPRGLPAAN